MRILKEAGAPRRAARRRDYDRAVARAATAGRPRRRRRPEEAEREILEAAEALLRERPSHEVTVMAVMARTTLSRKSFYVYFRDRHELIARLVAPLRAALDAPGVAGADATVRDETGEGRRAALPAVEAAFVGVDIRGWYGRPLAERWADYQGAAWRPIRLGTRGIWLAAGLLVAGGIVRAAGRSLFTLPILIVVPLRFLALLLFRPRLEPGTAHGSARWAPWWVR